MRYNNSEHLFGSIGRPSEYMRARRPYLFSDTKRTTKPALDRDFFEYILDNITSRKQEYDFEHFCRQMAEKEICKNLIPQTGPTGGGDGKTDSETYPVAESVYETWFEGNANASSGEKWAFAFSAKKDWRSKVRADVEKIVDTQRGYKHILFISNQFISAKKKTEVEQELQMARGVSITILDRNWLVTKVFENNRIQLAIDALKISSPTPIEDKIPGPNDAARIEELEQIEARIEDDSYYQGVEYQRIEDCLRGAILSRGLEHPRPQVEGRFLRAQTLADKNNSRQQKLRVTYNRAWTAHFWYDDIVELDKLYDIVEELAVNSSFISDIEMLSNLWQLVNVAVRKPDTKIDQSKFDVRTERLRGELKRFMSYQDRASTSLQAKSMDLLIRAARTLPNGEDPTQILGDFREIFENSAGLVEYPLESFVEAFQILGSALSDNDEYDKILDLVAELQSKRHQDAAIGELFLTRGIQKMESDSPRPFDAIRILGKAINHLAMDETKKDFVFALVSCGLAYESVGLLWAARSCYLNAANQAYNVFHESGKIILPAFLTTRKMVWIELQLGRIWPVLSWIQLQTSIIPGLALTPERITSYEEEYDLQKKVLGLLLLKSNLADLKSLGQLPHLLENEGQWESEMALRYALGDISGMRQDETLPKSWPDAEVLEFFGKWLRQPAADDIPSHPEFYLGETVSLWTSILGCKVEAIVENDLFSIELGEFLLAALEALLATSADKLFTYKATLTISIRKNADIQTIEHKIEEDGGPIDLDVTYPSGLDFNSTEQRAEIREWAIKAITGLVSNVFGSEGLERHLRRLIEEEEVMDRAFTFTTTSVAAFNILGRDQKRSISDWGDFTEVEPIPLTRGISWNTALAPADEPKAEMDSSRKGIGEANPKVHRDRQIASIINVPLWDSAEWKGTVYMQAGPTAILGLAFSNPTAGKSIFEEWNRKFAHDDTAESIEISVITGVSARNPFYYRVMVTMNTEGIKGKGLEIHFIANVNQMEPSNSLNLDRFLKTLEQTGEYYLIPAWFRSETLPPEPFIKYAIKKRKFNVIPAWQITETHSQMAALRSNDKPLIPSNEPNAPVIRTLQFIRDIKESRKKTLG